MRKMLLLFGMVAILIIGAYLGLSFYAVQLVHSRIQKRISPEMTLSQIQVRLTHLSIRGVCYKEQGSKERIFQIEEINLYPSLLSLLKGYLGFKEMVLLKPSFLVFRSKEGRVLIPLTGVSEKEGRGGDFPKEKKEKSLLLKIDQIRVLNGSIDFEDRKIGDPPSQISLRELDIKIEGIEFPFVPIPFRFKLDGKMRGAEREGSIKIEGWLNPKTVEFESFLTAREIGVKVFEPYYRKRVSVEVENGLIDMEAKVGLRKRAVDIQGDMELVDLQIKGSGGKVFWIPADLFSSQLKKKGGRLTVPFRIQGDLDDPKFNLQESILIQIGLSLAESLGMPVKIFPDGKEDLRKDGN